MLKFKLLKLKILIKDIKQERLKQNYKIIVTLKQELFVFLQQINTVVGFLPLNRFIVSEIAIIPNK